MSKAVVIKEGNVGRKFRPVSKLEINDQGGMHSLWRTAVEMDKKSITENGFYLAYRDSLYAYDEVEVNVTMLSEKEKKMGKTITGIDPTTGNPVSVGVDDDGNLTEEMLPDHIHIVIPPTKREYASGDVIDFSGIHVYLMNADNTRFTSDEYSTGEIPFDELTFPVTTVPEGSEIVEKSATYNDYTVYYGNPPSDVFYHFGDADGQGVYKNTYGHCTVNESGNFYAVITSQINGAVTSYNIYVFGQSAFTGTRESYNKKQESISATTKHTSLNGTDYYYALGSGSVDSSYSNLFLSITPTPINSLDSPNDKIADALFKGTHSAGENEIPVQWMRSDGETLEDKFTITISSGSSSGSSSSGSSSSGGEHSGGDF